MLVSGRPNEYLLQGKPSFAEYDKIASGIIKVLDDGYTLRDTLISQFSIWFDVELPLDKLEEIIRRMSIPT